jgi:hypothetical protein
MSNSLCQVFPPANAAIEGGVKVYRCTGVVATENDTEADILYAVSLVLQTSNGYRVETDQRDIVAPPGPSSSGPFYADIPADSFAVGDVVTFTAHIGVTGGFAGTDIQSNQITIQ